MSKYCYVIMPYGGSDPKKKAYFEGIFQVLIKIPAEKCGYEVKREDHEGVPGDITRNLISHLAEGNLVIADISDLNWNVAYELGMRHVLSKSGTILLANEDVEPLPFDISTLQVIKYKSGNEDLFAQMSEIHSLIEKAILQREGKPLLADNQIHNTYPDFPVFIKDYIRSDDDQEKKQINALTLKLDTLTQENAKLRALIENAGLQSEGKAEQENDISAKIAKAMRAVEYSGNRAIVKLREMTSADEPDSAEIGSFLTKVLVEGYLTEDNLLDIYKILRQQDNPILTTLILEEAVKRYPQNIDFKGYLADLYSDNYSTRDKAIKFANEILGVKLTGSKYTVACKKIEDSQLANCLNAYIGCDMYQLIADIGDQLLQNLPSNREMVLRNLAVIHRKLGNMELADGFMRQLLSEYPMKDQNHYRAWLHLRDRGENTRAYRQLEIAMALDPQDTDYLRYCAGHIFDMRMFREDEEILTNISGHNQLAMAAIPFLMQMMVVSPTQSTFDQCKEFLRKNNCGQYIDSLYEWVKEGAESHGIAGMNYGPLDYVLELTQGLTEENCREL